MEKVTPSRKLLEPVPENERVWLPNLTGHNCFACGPSNPQGLGMRFYLHGDTVKSDVFMGENHAGWETLVHGGLISTVLDEIMGFAVITFIRKFVVTRKMEIRYLRPVEVCRDLTAQGHVESVEGTRVKVGGVLFDQDGRRSATSSAEMAIVPDKRLSMLPDKIVAETLEVFRKMERLVERGAA